MESIGLMVTNPVWQKVLHDNYDKISHEVISWELCQEFPINYQERCVTGAVDNIMNFDELDLTRAKAFCSTVEVDYRSACYYKIGVSLNQQSTEDSAVVDRCAELNGFEELCRQGAGL
jgi:hypothetical protein